MGINFGTIAFCDSEARRKVGHSGNYLTAYVIMSAMSRVCNCHSLYKMSEYQFLRQRI